MRITKHEAAVLATALNEWDYSKLSNSNRPTHQLFYQKIENLLKRLEDYEEDKRLYSTSGRAKSYPSLTEIILTKLK
jgi:seryl-tRNA(Sec) selenium transferase